MPPALGRSDSQIHLHKRTPLRPLRLADELHSGLARGAIPFLAVTPNARADNIFPSGGSAPVPGYDMVQVQVPSIKRMAAILAGILIPFKKVVTGELDLFLGVSVKESKHDDSGDPDLEGDGMDPFAIGGIDLLGKVTPFVEIESLKIPLAVCENHLGLPLEKEGHRPLDRANIDGLPQTV